MKQRVAVLGTGRMGSALALALLTRGHVVTVWNRTASKARALESQGAAVATTVQEAVSNADVVIGNVSDYAASVEILSPAVVAKTLGGKVLVQLTTGTPRQARELAAWAAAHHVSYLDGAIMATPHFIGQPECTILYSGHDELFEAHKPLLVQLGGNAVYVGADMGHASTLDAAVLTVFWGSLFGSWHAAALCEAEAFPLEVLASTLRSIMPIFEDSLKDSVERIAQRRFAADDSSMASLEICYASAKLIHQMSREHGVHLGLTQALTTVFERATAAGFATDDVAAAYRVMRS